MKSNPAAKRRSKSLESGRMALALDRAVQPRRKPRPAARPGHLARLLPHQSRPTSSGCSATSSAIPRSPRLSAPTILPPMPPADLARAPSPASFEKLLEQAAVLSDHTRSEPDRASSLTLVRSRIEARHTRQSLLVLFRLGRQRQRPARHLHRRRLSNHCRRPSAPSRIPHPSRVTDPFGKDIPTPPRHPEPL